VKEAGFEEREVVRRKGSQDSGMPVILAIWEAAIRRIEDRGQHWVNSSQDPISKMTRAKWAGGVAQVVEHLLCYTKSPHT
jgi:hypothetical protein